MILQALYELRQREWVGNPDFVMKEVDWIVRLATDGRLLGITGTQSTGQIQGDKARKTMAKPFLIPRQPTGRSGTKAPPCFFVDNAKYVFGLPTRDKKFDPADGREKAATFRDLIAECAGKTKDEGARAVLAFLENVASAQTTVILDDNTKSNDLFAFIVAPDVDCLVHERPAIVDFWKQKRAENEQRGEKNRVCLVTGMPIGDPPLFPLIRGVPGKGTSTGVGLVSFNKEAFKSYGWAGNDNASISRNAAEACSDALNWLLSPTLPRRNVKLSGDTVVCFWTKQPSNFDSVLAGLLEGNTDEVAEQYRSIWRGKLFELSDPTAFYALTLSGSQGRAIVRDWFESTVQEVAHNLNQHFADLEIVRNTKPVRGAEAPPCFALGVLLESIAANGKREDIPPSHAAAIVHAALEGTPYPFSIFQRAVERHRAEIGRDKWADSNRRDARAAIIKAVLNRRRRSLAAPNYEEVSPNMDPSVASEGYVLGRLLAVLERLQQEAQGEINATVIDRYFSGASASPKSVFVRLLKNARHHVSKIKGEGAKYGFALRLEKIVDETAERFDPKHNGFPAYLDLEQQGLFILGYHQMRHWLWLSRADREAWQREHPAVPRPYVWNTSNDSSTQEEEQR